MDNDNLIINSLETEREKHFKSKINRLLIYFSKERIVENYSSLTKMQTFLTDSSLNIIDIFHILAKKYYLCNVKENEINKNYNTLIEQLNFEYSHHLLLSNTNLRIEMLCTYIDNINVPNNFLAIEKAYNHYYDNIGITLEKLNDFYIAKRFNDINTEYKTLKKSHN